jgi:hypothetical protein
MKQLAILKATLAALVMLCSLNASAAIIGMLVEDEITKIELVGVSEDDYIVRIAVTRPAEYPLENLYLSPYLGGEGGDVAKIIAALQKGEVPPFTKVAEWMTADTDRPSAKVGLFTRNEKFSFVSMYTGQPTEIKHIKAQLINSEKVASGVKQTFEFRFPYVVTNEDWLLLKARQVDLTLVTQTRAAIGFDMELKRSIELSADALFVSDDIYIANVRAEHKKQCEDLIKTEKK